MNGIVLRIERTKLQLAGEWHRSHCALCFEFDGMLCAA